MHIVEMVAVWDFQMGIVFAMHMIGMKGDLERSFSSRVLCGHLERMLVHMSVVHKVQVSIMQVIPMVDVPDSGMAAIVSMDVGVI